MNKVKIKCTECCKVCRIVQTSKIATTRVIKRRKKDSLTLRLPFHD